MMSRRCFLSVSICVHLWLLSPAMAASGPIEPEVDGVIGLPMFHDPSLEPPVQTTTFHPRLNSLWLAALNQPDAELRREATLAFAEAGSAGMELPGVVYARLVELMTDDADLSVRIAAAEALGRLDHAEAADAMLTVNRGATDVELIRVTDEALAKWRHGPAVAVWIGRATDPAAADAIRRSAMQALGETGASEAIQPLLAVATGGDAAAALRLEAADALAAIGGAGLVQPASALADGAVLDRLVATRMLSGADDPQAVAVLDGLITAADQTAAAVAQAARSLLAIGPEHVTRHLDRLIDHPDSAVRLVLAQSLEQLPEADRTAISVAPLLDDPGVKVRHAARRAIWGVAEAGGDIRGVVAAALAGGGRIETGGGSASLPPFGWRGIEQAALLAGAIDFEAQAGRLIELLRHDRAEVRLAAAAALRQLAVPQTLPALFARAAQLTDQVKAAAASDPGALKDAGQETTQLFMAIGAMGYAPADALLRRYIPKHSGFTPRSRAAAVYALGKLHEGKPDQALIRAFASRLSDVSPMDPEATEVRRFAAIGLGRMDAESQLSVLRRFYDEENASVHIGGATRWAIMRITGDDLPPLKPQTTTRTGWFLEPTQ